MAHLFLVFESSAYLSGGCDFDGQVKRLYDAFHEPFRRTTKQLRLDDAVVKISQAANTELNTPVDSSTKPVDSTDTVVGVSESKADEPELTVRKALDAAHAKVVKRKVGSRTETSMKVMCSNGTQGPPVNIEVIDIT